MTSLGKLVEPEIFKAVLRQQWMTNGGKPSAHLLALANDLIAMATEWVKASADRLAELKTLRSKLGRLQGHGRDNMRGWSEWRANSEQFSSASYGYSVQT